MTKWVLPNVLSVDDVNELDVQLIKVLSGISTGVVLKYINDFINANIESSDIALQSAASKLQAGYKEVNEVNAYLASEDAKNLADTLASLQYSDVKHEVETPKLMAYRSLIIELLSEDKDFIESYTGEVSGSTTTGYKMAYTAKLDKSNLEAAIGTLSRLSMEILGQQACGSKLSMAVSKNANLFKNGSNKVNKPTVLRKAIYQKDRLKSILKGIDYLLEKKEAGTSPRAWRRI